MGRCPFFNWKHLLSWHKTYTAQWPCDQLDWQWQHTAAVSLASVPKEPQLNWTAPAVFTVSAPKKKKQQLSPSQEDYHFTWQPKGLKNAPIASSKQSVTIWICHYVPNVKINLHADTQIHEPLSPLWLMENTRLSTVSCSSSSCVSLGITKQSFSHFYARLKTSVWEMGMLELL